MVLEWLNGGFIDTDRWGLCIQARMHTRTQREREGESGREMHRLSFHHVGTLACRPPLCFRVHIKIYMKSMEQSDLFVPEQ